MTLARLGESRSLLQNTLTRAGIFTVPPTIRPSHLCWNYFLIPLLFAAGLDANSFDSFAEILKKFPESALGKFCNLSLTAATDSA